MQNLMVMFNLSVLYPFGVNLAEKIKIVNLS